MRWLAVHTLTANRIAGAAGIRERTVLMVVPAAIVRRRNMPAGLRVNLRRKLRGYRVCKRWRSFVDFREDMGLRPSPQHRLTRTDTSGPFSPDNVRWSLRPRRERCPPRRQHLQATNLPRPTPPRGHGDRGGARSQEHETVSRRR